MHDYEYVIRQTQLEDIQQIAAIYAHEVRTGTASFEIEPPTPAQMTERVKDIWQNNYGHYVAVRHSTVLGYAYTSGYRSRPAYRFSVENSVYVASDSRGKGIASKLLQALFDDCKDKPFHQMIAIIGDSANHASINLHRSMGFKDTGVLKDVGYKFDRWIDSVIMQKKLR
ncbi:MAG: L-amino acid N-acyltransferase YncA [Parasphingorhabdus sp.]|jgi:L-amino acid N-acyltransferase YncA